MFSNPTVPVYHPVIPDDVQDARDTTWAEARQLLENERSAFFHTLELVSSPSNNAAMAYERADILHAHLVRLVEGQEKRRAAQKKR